MSLEAAGEFWLELHANAEATARADTAYLDAVRSIAAEQGYDVTNDELRDALRAIAGLDDSEGEAEGFGIRDFRQPIADTVYGYGDSLAAGPLSAGDSIYIGGGSPFPQFSPLGFLR